MPEITLEEYELMNRILSDTRTGWWKADYRLQTYFFSKQIMELTGLPSDRLSFADFLNRIRTDFRFRIGEEIATLEQPYVYDMTFPILCPKGEIWILPFPRSPQRSYQKTSSGKKCAWRFYYHRLDTDRR